MAVNLKLVAEYSEVTEAITAVNSGLESVQKATNEANEDIKKLGKSGSDSLKGIENSAHDSVAALEAARKRIIDLQAALDKNKGDAGLVTTLNKELVKAKQAFVAAGGSLEEFGKKGKEANDKVGNSFKSLSEQTRAALKEVARAGAIYGVNSKEALAAAKNVSRLKDEQDALNAKIDALDPDRKFNIISQFTRGLAGGFTAAVGAAALFGEKNEKVEKTLVKIQAAMAFSQGINEVLELGKGFSALAAVLGITTAAKQADNVVTQESVVIEGESAVAHGVAATAIAAEGVAATETAVAVGVLDAALAILLSPITLVVAGIAALIAVVKIFSDTGEDFSHTLDQMALSNERFARITDDVNASSNSTLKKTENDIKQLEALGNRRIASLKAAGATEQQLAAAQKELDAQVLAAKIEQQKQIARLADATVEINLSQIQILLNRIGEAKRILGDDDASDDQKSKASSAISSALQEIINLRKANQEKIQAQKDANSEILQTQSEADAKTLEQRAELNAKLLEADKALISAKEDLQNKLLGSEDELATGERKLQIQLEQGRLELSALRAKLIEAGQLEENAAAASEGRRERVFVIGQKQQEELDKLDMMLLQKHQRDLEQLRAQNQTATLDFIKDEGQKELAAFDANFVERKQKFIDAGKSESDIEELRLKERFELQKKIQSDAVNLEEETQIAIINSRERGKESEIEFETNKQLDILKVQLEFAKKRLEIEEALFSIDPSAERQKNIAAIDATIKDIGKQIDSALSKLSAEGRKPISFARLIGLTGLSSEDEAEFNKQAGEVAGKFIEIAHGLLEEEISMNQARIDSNKEVIDSVNERISETQKGLELELELSKQGFASNVDAKRAELAALEKQQRDALAAQKKLVSEQNELKRQQALADSLVQASSLITAGATLFAKGAFEGPIGIITAIATIAGMLASFLSLKGKVGEVTKLKKGARLKGPSHENGGMRIEGTNIEVEGREWFVNADSSDKYDALLDAINSDDFKKLTAKDLRPLLKGTGVVLHDDVTKRAVTKSSEYSTTLVEYKNIISVDGLKSEIVEIKNEVREWRDESTNSLTIHALPNGDVLEIRKGGKDVTIRTK
jgi:hypothetical protein